MSPQELLTEIQKLPPAEQQRLLEALKRDVKMKSEQRPITEDEVEQYFSPKALSARFHLWQTTLTKTRILSRLKFLANLCLKLSLRNAASGFILL